MATKLIWVEEEFAKQYETFDRDAQAEAFKKFLQKKSDEVKEEYQNQLNNMKDDAAMYKGLMIEVRKEFEKFTNEHLEAQYTLWEQYDKDLPRLKDKVGEFLQNVKPLTAELQQINAEISKIQTWQLEKLQKIIETMSSLNGPAKEMAEFLVSNFKKEEK